MTLMKVTTNTFPPREVWVNPAYLVSMSQVHITGGSSVAGMRTALKMEHGYGDLVVREDPATILAMLYE